jgi:hypothetical protein
VTEQDQKAEAGENKLTLNKIKKAFKDLTALKAFIKILQRNTTTNTIISKPSFF